VECVLPLWTIPDDIEILISSNFPQERRTCHHLDLVRLAQPAQHDKLGAGAAAPHRLAAALQSRAGMNKAG
jgi:hypothetical protein